MNTLRVFVVTGCGRAGAAPSPGCLEPELGRFDEAVAARYDAVLDAAERHGVKVILTAFAVGFTPGDAWKGWEENPYAAARGGPAATPSDFFAGPAAREAARRALRYVLARWGASPALLAVDLLNEPEWDGAIPESDWIPWAAGSRRHVARRGSVRPPGDRRAGRAPLERRARRARLVGEPKLRRRAVAPLWPRRLRRARPRGRARHDDQGHGPLPEARPRGGVRLGRGSRAAARPHPRRDSAAAFAGAGVLAHSAPPFTIDSDAPMTPPRGRHFRALAGFLRRAEARGPLETAPDPGRVAPRRSRARAQGRSGARRLDPRAVAALWHDRRRSAGHAGRSRAGPLARDVGGRRERAGPGERRGDGEGRRRPAGGAAVRAPRRAPRRAGGWASRSCRPGSGADPGPVAPVHGATPERNTRRNVTSSLPSAPVRRARCARTRARTRSA